MLTSIVERNRFTSPISDSKTKILHSAIKLFLQKGYSNTTLKMISEDCKMAQGTITYHFHTKEDMLYMIMQALLEFHGDLIDATCEEVKDNLIAYATEVVVQIALCNQKQEAWDLYYSAYTHPATFIMIKDWTAKKNYRILKDRLPEWSETDFRELENISSCIELSAFTMLTNRDFTLEKKIYLVLNSLLKIYNISKEERKAVIEKILKLDYCKIGQDMFEKFIKKLDNNT